MEERLRFDPSPLYPAPYRAGRDDSMTSYRPSENPEHRVKSNAG